MTAVTASTAAPRACHLPLGRAFVAALAVVGVAALCAWGTGALDRERAPWIGIGAGVAIAVAHPKKERTQETQGEKKD